MRNGNGWLKANTGPLLAIITVTGTLALFGVAFFLKVDGANEKILFMVIGALSTVITYYFGSSEGSAAKNEMLREGRRTRITMRRGGKDEIDI